MKKRYTLICSDNGAESARIYDGTSRRTFLRHFCAWASRAGCAILAICPRDTDPLLDMQHTAATDIRYYDA